MNEIMCHESVSSDYVVDIDKVPTDEAKVKPLTLKQNQPKINTCISNMKSYNGTQLVYVLIKFVYITFLILFTVLL